MKKTVFLYCTGIDDVLTGGRVAGIQVQMSFWAKTFAQKGWNTYTLTRNKSITNIDGIHFIYTSSAKWVERLHLTAFAEIHTIISNLFKIRPNVVIIRGATRSVFNFNIFSKIFNYKLIFFAASDSDFDFGHEIISGAPINRKLYQKAITRIHYIVVQNKEQCSALKTIYHKDSLILSNIWIPSNLNIYGISQNYDAIWVSNMWPIKRAEWFVQLAKRLSNNKFAIIGGANRQNYYNQIKESTSKIPNIDFWGPQPFEFVNQILSQSRLLICTSEFEGFPNSFLQAWAKNIPVISTVNPSGIINKYNLGRVVDNEQALYSSTIGLLQNIDSYNQCKYDILRYFDEHHSADFAYSKLARYIHIN